MLKKRTAQFNNKRNHKNTKPSNRTKRTNSFYTKVIAELLAIKNSGEGRVTFFYRDGSMQSMPFSMKLFHDERGKERRFGDIISILNDLKHDFRALRYRIN